MPTIPSGWVQAPRTRRPRCGRRSWSPSTRGWKRRTLISRRSCSPFRSVWTAASGPARTACWTPEGTGSSRCTSSRETPQPTSVTCMRPGRSVLRRQLPGGTGDGGAAQSGSAYYLATEFCPREGNAAGVEPTVKEIALLNLQRERVNCARVARDENYLWENVETAGPCTVHTEELKPRRSMIPLSSIPTTPALIRRRGRRGMRILIRWTPRPGPSAGATHTRAGGTGGPGTVQPTPTPSEPEPGGRGGASRHIEHKQAPGAYGAPGACCCFDGIQAEPVKKLL